MAFTVHNPDVAAELKKLLLIGDAVSIQLAAISKSLAIIAENTKPDPPVSAKIVIEEPSQRRQSCE